MKRKSPIPKSDPELIALAEEVRAAQRAFYKHSVADSTRKQALLDESKLLEFKFDGRAPKESHNPILAAAIAMRTAQKAYYACSWKDHVAKKNLLGKARNLEAAFDRLASHKPDPQGVFFA